MPRHAQPPRPCSIEDCTELAYARGWCDRHYRRWLRTGDPELLIRESVHTVEPRDLGISYRQLDFWVRQGYLRPVRTAEGTGHWRDWPEAEQNVAREMGLLVRAGLLPQAAHRVAREGRAEAVLAALGVAA